MAIEVLIFGSLSDIVETPLQVEHMADTDMLIRELTRRYPGLAKSKYVIAVNKKMIDANTSLQNNDEVALMPPYSGG